MDLALNKLPLLICLKTKPNRTNYDPGIPLCYKRKDKKRSPIEISEIILNFVSCKNTNILVQIRVSVPRLLQSFMGKLNSICAHLHITKNY